VVVYCASGYRSSLAASILKAGGFAATANAPGGYQAWTAAGFPTVKPPDAGKKASDTER
jgi:hydroxyacylglutathione hydrolase